MEICTSSASKLPIAAWLCAILFSGCSHEPFQPIESIDPWPMTSQRTWIYASDSYPGRTLEVTLSPAFLVENREYRELSFSLPVAGFRSVDTLSVVANRVYTYRDGRDHLWIDWTNVDSASALYYYSPVPKRTTDSDMNAISTTTLGMIPDAYVSYNIDMNNPIVDVHLRKGVGPVCISFNNRTWYLTGIQ